MTETSTRATGQLAGTIGYAPRPTLIRRKWFRRWAVAIIVLLIIGGVAFQYGGAMRRHVLLLLAQRRCMAYQPTPGGVAFWYQDNLGSTSRPGTGSPGSSSFYTFLRHGTFTKTVPEDWDRFYALHSPPGLTSSGTVFLHGRQTPSGSRRLVAIDCLSVSDAYLVRVIRPGALLSSPAEVTNTVVGAFGSPGSPNYQVMEGTADPSDPTHFTFDVISDGQTIHIDGFLRNDNQVVLERR